MRDGITYEHYIRKFLNGVAPETVIYKYIPLRYIESMKRNRRMRFNLVNSWEDVYENYFLKQNFQTENGLHVDPSDVSNRIYGQSWTMCEESDAMWRIYSQGKSAIKVRTTAGKLMDVLYTDDRCMADTYIGKVDYQSQQDIEKVYRDMEQSKLKVTEITGINDIEKFIIESLITKRNEFVHEEEVRILKMISTEDGIACDYLEQTFDPDMLFEEYVMDPRVSDIEECRIRRCLELLGIDPGRIRKSHLYDLNKYTLTI